MSKLSLSHTLAGAAVALVLFAASAVAQVSGVAAVSSGSAGTSGTSGTYWGQGAASGSGTTQAGCDPAIQNATTNSARFMVDNYAQMATSLYPTLPAGGFSGLSCLQQLLNSGLNMFWSPSSLSQILAAILAEVCSVATEMVVEAEQPLYTSLYASAPMGQIVPGVNLGGLFNGGVTASPMVGNSGGGLLNITGPSNLMTGGAGTTSFGSGNLASYWGGGGQNTQQANPYGSLFGTGGGITGMTNTTQPASSGGSFLSNLW